MKHNEDVNVYDLSSVARAMRNRKKKKSISSLRSTDINSCGGPNSSVEVKKQKLKDVKH